MSTLIATINVNFTSNYVGCHRMFWKRSTESTYNGPFLATPPCLGGGAPCTISFYDTVDTESCTAIQYEGYVQACCREESDPAGRIPFSVTFTPAPSCTPINVTCNFVEVFGLAPLNEGSGYDPMTPPSVSFIGGGSPSIIATATATVGTGDIDSLALSNQPTGPDIPSGVTYGPVGVIAVAPATGIAQVTATSASDGDNITCPINGGCPYINSITVVSSSGWNVGDQFYIDPSAIGNIGTAVPFNVTTATITDTDYGKIIGYVITNPGADYSSIPTVVVDPPPGPGTNATADVEMTKCADAWTRDKRQRPGPRLDARSIASAFLAAVVRVWSLQRAGASGTYHCQRCEGHSAQKPPASRCACPRRGCPRFPASSVAQAVRQCPRGWGVQGNTFRLDLSARAPKPKKVTKRMLYRAR